MGDIDLSKKPFSDLLDPADLDIDYGRGAHFENPFQQELGPGPTGSMFQLRVAPPEFLLGQADGRAAGCEIHRPDQLSAVLDPLLAGQRGFVTGSVT